MGVYEYEGVGFPDRDEETDAFLADCFVYDSAKVGQIGERLGIYGMVTEAAGLPEHYWGWYEAFGRALVDEARGEVWAQPEYYREGVTYPRGRVVPPAEWPIPLRVKIRVEAEPLTEVEAAAYWEDRLARERASVPPAGKGE